MPNDARIATFFVRCPEPVGFPPGSIHILDTIYPLAGFENACAHLNADGTAPSSQAVLHNTMFVSARFHHGWRAISPVESAIDEMSSIVNNCLPSSTPASGLKNKELSATNDQWSSYWVAELSTPLAIQNADGIYVPAREIPLLINEAFERSVESLFSLIRAYRASEKLALRTPTRERLGPIFYVVTRKAAPGESAWDTPALLMVNSLDLPPTQPPILDQSGIERIGMAIHAEFGSHPMIPVAELRADAQSSLSTGDYRAALMLFHTASEVHLDVALMLMQWEEGLTPEEAVEIYRKSLMERVRSQYHIRTGGAWSKASDAWHKDLVLPRHRTIHGGFPVTPDAAVTAHDAYAAMFKFATDRLAASVGKYPKTAAIAVSQQGFEKRGRITRRIREALEASTLETLFEFDEWRNKVLQLRAS